MITLVAAAAVFGLTVGFLVFWTNPNRLPNQIFASFSVLYALQWGLHLGALIAGEQALTDQLIDPIPWIRANATATGFIPLALWLLRESVRDKTQSRLAIVLRSWPWIVLAVILGIICYSESFIPSNSPQYYPKRGTGYSVRTALLIIALLGIVCDSLRQTRRLSGIQRIEMTFLALTGGLVTLLSILLISVSNYLHIPKLRPYAIILTIIGYTIMSWAITVHTVFDARQIFFSLVQRTLMLFAVIVGTIAITLVFGNVLPQSISIIISFVICSLLVARCDRQFRNWLGIGDERELAMARQIVMDTAANVSGTRATAEAFENLLQRFSGAKCVTLWTEQTTISISSVSLGNAGYQTLAKVAWVTPESIERLRESPQLAELGAYLKSHSLGLMIAAPRGSPAPSLVIGLGKKSNGWPYTFPEVRKLQDIAELMDNMLIHSRLATEAAMKAKIEDMTVISRGLAHDFKNLITPISSLLVHMEGQYSAQSSEGEVHAAAKQSVTLMMAYIRDAFFFASRLEPRFELAEACQILDSIKGAANEAAGRRAITITFSATPGQRFVADSVLIQRMLLNLITNAIDASRAGSIVTVTAEITSDQQMRLEVADCGAGISKENLARVFEPYFTTKQFGHEQRGFGLGLTICEKIVQLHGGIINVTSQVGIGTTIRTEFPLQPDCTITLDRPRSATTSVSEPSIV